MRKILKIDLSKELITQSAVSNLFAPLEYFVIPGLPQVNLRSCQAMALNQWLVLGNANVPTGYTGDRVEASFASGLYASTNDEIKRLASSVCDAYNKHYSNDDPEDVFGVKCLRTVSPTCAVTEDGRMLHVMGDRQLFDRYDNAYIAGSVHGYRDKTKPAVYGTVPTADNCFYTGCICVSGRISSGSYEGLTFRPSQFLRFTLHKGENVYNTNVTCIALNNSNGHNLVVWKDADFAVISTFEGYHQESGTVWQCLERWKVAYKGL